MLLTISPLAKSDLENIADFIARDNPRRALSFIQEIRAQCLQIAQKPSMYRRRTELGDDIRSCTHGKYLIYFSDTPDEVTIIRVLHSARDLPSIFGSVD